MKNAIRWGTLIMIAILLTGCTRTGSTQLAGVEIWSPPMGDLRWGMTMDEAITALALKEGEYETYKENSMSGLVLSKATIYQSPTRAELVFDVDLGLHLILAKYPPEDVEAVSQAIDKALGTGVERLKEGNDSYKQWQGSMASDLTADDQAAFQAIWDERMGLLKKEDTPLFQWNLYTTPNSPRYGEAEFSGTGYALLLYLKENK